MNTINPYTIYQPNFGAIRRKISKAADNEPIQCVKASQESRFNNAKESITAYIKNYPYAIKYTAQHKKAFLKTEKELTGKNTLSGYFHDTDKLILYILGVPPGVAHKTHTQIAPHPVRDGKVKKPVQAIIDWECARYTKPDKQLSAREFYESYYLKKKNIRIPEIEEKLEELGL